MRKYSFLFLFLFVQHSLTAQEVSFFPSQLNVQPFTANFLEPKLGFNFKLAESELRLDIGTSQDIFHLQTDNNSQLSFGADLFTYTRLRGEKNFHFPVDAVDYLFGINCAYKVSDNYSEYGFRFRVSHISAHFVDGHFDNSSQSWRDGRAPRVYSREFIEVFPFYQYKSLRVYTGITYLFNVSPDLFGKGVYQIGFDYYLENFFGEKLSPFAAYDLKLGKINKYYGSNILSAGLKFGEYKSKGFSILVSYFSGKSVHGEYFDVNEHYTTFGFNLDL